jgi:hypothetical protein
MSPYRTLSVVFALALGVGLAASPVRAAAPVANAPAADNPDVVPPVTAADLKVVQRARAILNSPEKWNRADTRKCPPEETTYSLYCALETATTEVTGSFEHRGSAMQQARFVIDALTANRNYDHRLKDYNNDPTTSFADIQHVFDLIEARISEKLKAR